MEDAPVMQWPIERITRLLTHLAGVSLTIMMLVTVADVFLRNVADRPILGSVEIVQGALVYMVFFGIPETFRRGGHIVVDVADHLFDVRVIAWLDAFARILTLVFLAVMLWTMWGRARDAYTFGDVTSDLGIPLVGFWIPLIFGGLCSLLAVFFLAARDVKLLARGS